MSMLYTLASLKIDRGERVGHLLALKAARDLTSRLGP